MQSPLQYFWLIINIIIFYIFVAYGIALWGQYICWEAEKEEKEINKALKKYFKEVKEEQKKLTAAKKLQIKDSSQKMAIQDKKESDDDEDDDSEDDSSDEE